MHLLNALYNAQNKKKELSFTWESMPDGSICTYEYHGNMNSHTFKIYNIFILYAESYSTVITSWSSFGTIFDEMVPNCANYLVITFVKFVTFYKGSL